MDLNNQNALKKRKVIFADIGLALVAVVLGGGFVASKFGLTAITPLTFNAYRYMGAAIIVFLFTFKKLHLFKNKYVWIYGAICGVNMFIGNAMQTIGLLYTTAGKQSFIVSLYIILVPLFSWIVLKKRPSNSVLTAAIIGFIGVALITLTDNFTIEKGDLMTFTLAVTFSIQIIFTANVVKDIDPTVFTFVLLTVVGILSSIAAIIVDGPVMPNAILGMALPGVLGLLYAMVLNSSLALLLENICLKYAPANLAAILLSLQTVFGTIFAVTIAGEVFSPRMITGCALMFIAIGIVEVSGYRQK